MGTSSGSQGHSLLEDKCVAVTGPLLGDQFLPFDWWLPPELLGLMVRNLDKSIGRELQMAPWNPQ